MTLDYHFTFKVICVGDGGCGKTAIIVRFTQDVFREKWESTIGVGFSVKHLTINEKRIRLTVWDTGGQERFANVRTIYYKGSSGALCVFDLTNRASFDNVPKWLDEIKANGGEMPVVLVGNKSDLPNRQVPRVDAEVLAKKANLNYMESSAKTGEGVGDCFALLAGLMLSKVSSYAPSG